MVRIVLVADTDRKRGGRDGGTVEFLLPLLAVPVSVTHFLFTDAGTQPTPENGFIISKKCLLFLVGTGLEAESQNKLVFFSPEALALLGDDWSWAGPGEETLQAGQVSQRGGGGGAVR